MWSATSKWLHKVLATKQKLAVTTMRVCSLLSQWCLLFCLIAVGGGRAEHNLTYIFITSFGQNGFDSSGLIPAADMALEDINNNSQVLPGYNLMYDTLRDSEVSLQSNKSTLQIMNGYFNSIRLPQFHALLPHNHSK